MNKRPTIKDVAAHSGVSKSTVSLVLQESPLVKAQTRKAVRASMEALGYVRNRAAAALRGSGTGLVGLLINDLRNPFFTEFAASAQATFLEQGIATVIANSDEDPEIQHQVIASMLEHEVSGILMSPCYGETAHTFDAIAKRATPAIQVLRQGDMRDDLFPFLSIDYETGSRLAVDHLLAQGLRDIAFVGGQADYAITQERMHGYQNAVHEHGLTPHIHHGRATRACGREIAFDLLKTKPHVRAAICFNDLVALGMMSAFAEAGVTVGQDFFIVGFDDIEECSQVFPKLSSVHCDIAGFGAQSAQMVLKWLETGEKPVVTSRAPVWLEIRQSSLVPGVTQ